MANKRNSTLYVGVTSDLVRRVYIHRNSLVDDFSKKYACKMLVWYEQHGSMETAILREKQLKDGNRHRKLELIESMDPDWQDCMMKLFDWIAAPCGLAMTPKIYANQDTISSLRANTVSADAFSCERSAAESSVLAALK